MLAEIRAYGEGLIIAEQIPSKLTVDVIKNTAVKIVHRLPAQDDRESVGATMNLDEAQSRRVVALEPSQGVVFSDGMDRPLLIQRPFPSKRDADGVQAQVADVVDRRSATCTAACFAEPCTLRQMREAQHLLSEQRWLTLWAELTVVAHLTGDVVLVPTDTVLRAFTTQQLPTRQVECAISHSVDNAVLVRSSILAPTTKPLELASHVYDVLTRILDGGEPSCGGDELQYVVPAYRWVHALAALSSGRIDSTSGVDSPEWERILNEPIMDATRSEQLEAVEKQIAVELTEDLKDLVAYGTRRPSALEAAFGAMSKGLTPTAEEVERRLKHSFQKVSWPLELLVEERGATR